MRQVWKKTSRERVCRERIVSPVNRLASRAESEVVRLQRRLEGL